MHPNTKKNTLQTPKNYDVGGGGGGVGLRIE